MGNYTFRGGLYALLVLVSAWALTVPISNLTFGLPLSALPSPVQSGILAADFAGTDGSGGAALDARNKESLADGAVASALLSDSFSCGNGTGCNGSIAPVGADQILLHGGANMDIGINAVFSKTPRDSTRFDIRLEIVPVPVPAAFTLRGAVFILATNPEFSVWSMTLDPGKV